MNKSTPLNQLPNNPMMQTAFVNEQQRQMVTNAQQAVGSIQMPQNSQMQPDITDDDAEIQEALNDVHAQLQQPPPRPPSMMAPATYITQPQQPPQQQEYFYQQQPQQPPQYYPAQQQLPNIPIENQADLMFMQGMNAPPPPQAVAPPPAVPVSKQTSNMLMDIVTRFADDVKLAAIVAVVVFAVRFIPISAVLGKYIALDRIPYSNIILQAVIAATFVVLLKNIISASQAF